VKKEVKRKISLSLKGYYSNPKNLEKARKIWHNSSYRKNLSVLRKKYFSNPENREKLRKIFNSPLNKKKRSLSKKKYYADSGNLEKYRNIWRASSFRKKISSSLKRYYKENPKAIQKIDRVVTKWWKEHPNLRKEKGEAVRKIFIDNPERLKQFLKYGKNPSKPHLKTKQGFLVRSKGEQKIADFLYENKITSLYESRTLIFKKEGQICVPDFYLPSDKIYIEYYGGFPKSWKKKVMKNKLYKKYKIPCVFITPRELRDLGYYLVGELRKKQNL
jgi:hypothetical protein